MRICGVDIKSNEARIVIAEEGDGPVFVRTNTKRIVLADDRDVNSLKAFQAAIGTFAHENGVEIFAIKSRAKKGSMAGGAVSFKIETLFQLCEQCDVEFVNPVALAGFAKKNIAGVPQGVLAYQSDAYRCAAFVLDKKGLLA